MKLFISHASEDKADFVRPLVKSLETDFEIWYDEYELKIGDSLLQKINEGLATCDYGVVVLSPDFFRKKYPKAELDGLYALQTSNRKVILPVWLNVTEADVASNSPILAGMLAARASDGMKRVVDDIKKAVGLVQLSESFGSPANAVERLKWLDQKTVEGSRIRNLVQSVDGVQLATQSFHAICAGLERYVHEFQGQFQTFEFKCSRPQFGGLDISASHRLTLAIRYTSSSSNSVEADYLSVDLYRQRDYGETAIKIYAALKVKPWFDADSNIIWKDKSSSKTYTHEQLVSLAIDRLITELADSKP